MQTKKGDIKEKIKESAKEIFFTVAYKDASMRDVAAKSGMTVGNIYRYYENKEVLFDEILKDTYSGVIKLVKITDIAKIFIRKRTVSDENAVVKSSKFKTFLLETIIKIVANHSAELYILLTNSEGSKYEDTKQKITSLIKETITKRIAEMTDDRADTYAYLTINTFSYLLKKYKDDDEKLKQEIKYFFEKLFQTF